MSNKSFNVKQTLIITRKNISRRSKINLKKVHLVFRTFFTYLTTEDDSCCSRPPNMNIWATNHKGTALITTYKSNTYTWNILQQYNIYISRAIEKYVFLF